MKHMRTMKVQNTTGEMRKLKIGIITDETDTQLVGFGYYTLNLVKHILLLDKKNEYYLIHRKKENHEIYSMANEIIIPYNKRFPFSTIRNFITLPLKLRKYNLDVVHHLASIGPFVFKSFIKGKAVQTIHELLPLRYPESFEFPVRTVFKLLIPRIARNVDHIFTACTPSKIDISRRFKVPLEKIEVIFPGTDPRIKPMSKEAARKKVAAKYRVRKPYLLFVSTLEAKKNIPTLLKAYRKLLDSGLKHALILVGKKGYGYEQIAASIRELGLQNDVVLPGYVPLEDLPAFYSAADAFVFPAFDAGNMTIGDAMKCGCPVIAASGEENFLEAYGNACIRVGTNDVDGYVAAVEKIVGNRKFAAKMQRKSLAQARKLTWEASARQTIAAYERLCSGLP